MTNKPHNPLCKYIKILRKKFPSNKNIRVLITVTPYNRDINNKIAPPKKRVYGITYDKNTHYIIKININDPLAIQLDTLMHEWAHCLAGWNNKGDHHSDKWGLAYAKIYREIVK
jgi:hypothetical protein